VMREDKIRQSDYMLAQRYNDLLRACSDVKEKTIYLPFEAYRLSGLVGSLYKVYGEEGPRSAPTRKVSAAQLESAGVAGADDSALD